MSLKSGVKRLVDLLGVNDSAIRWHRSKMLVLCYHAVVAERREHSWSYDNCVDRQSFLDQLVWLKSLMEPTDLAGLRKWRDGGWTAKKGPLLITFDDGYRNNLTQAAPILQREGVPALFFLATGLVGTDRVLWNDEMRVRISRWPEPEIRMPSGEVAAVPREIEARRDLATHATQNSKALASDSCAEYLAYLRSKTPSLEVMDDPEARAFMTWDEVRQLKSMGFEVGAHTVEHPILSQAEANSVDAELRDSKAKIERELNCPCVSMAYPNGTEKDVNAAVVASARRAGYEWSFMTTPYWHQVGDDPHCIPRICVPGHAGLDAFKLYASGLRSFLAGGA